MFTMELTLVGWADSRTVMTRWKQEECSLSQPIDRKLYKHREQRDSNKNIRITFSISMYTMCVCLFNALSRRAGALQISIIIMIIITVLRQKKINIVFLALCTIISNARQSSTRINVSEKQNKQKTQKTK